LDASALSGPLTLGEYGQISVDGLITGDVLVNGSLEGTGEVTGDVTVPFGSYIYPRLGGTLHIDGDLTAENGSSLEFDISGTLAEEDHTRLRVTGAVNLAGTVVLFDGFDLLEDDSAVLLLNDGTDPINGTFDGLPEGAAVPIGNGLAFQVTYLANGDGGAVGNDFGVTVVPDLSTDISLFADAPVAVDLGGTIIINYSLNNFGPNPLSSGVLQITLPGNASFVNSTPSATPVGNTLSIPIPALAISETTNILVQLAAPGTTGSVFVDATAYSLNGDPFTFDNSAPTLTAVLPGGCPVLDVFTVDSLNDQMTLGIDALDGVRYLLEGSLDLDDWYGIEEFIGSGEPYEIIQPMLEDKEFFRFKILPYSGGGGIGEGS
jgi:hypothetical protein